MWMPHDDSFPADYIPLLRDALDRRPDAILAFGSIRPIGLDGELLPDKIPQASLELGQLPRADEAIRLRSGLEPGGAVSRTDAPPRGAPAPPVHTARHCNESGTTSRGCSRWRWWRPSSTCPAASARSAITRTATTRRGSERRVIDELSRDRDVGRYMVAARVPLPVATRSWRTRPSAGCGTRSWKLPYDACDPSCRDPSAGRREG